MYPLKMVYKNEMLMFYEDQGSHSCGESRSDWRFVGSVKAKRFAEQFLGVLEKKEGTVYL